MSKFKALLETAFNPMIASLESLKTQVEDWRNKAQEWAEKPEDQAVETGQFSAKHHASKSSASATASETAKGQSETARDQSVTAKNQSESARDGSVTAQGLSESARDDSVVAKDQSEAARDKSEKWAEENEDVAVETGQFSSKHHAIKSSASATVSDQAKTDSESARDKASEWAEKAEDVEVETGQFSAKHHATKADASAQLAAEKAGISVQGIKVIGRLANESELPANPDTGDAYVIEISGIDRVYVYDGADWIAFDVGAGTEWGQISGTLSNQTDLNNALSGKEDVFTKNSAFNKNFGDQADTVTQGDDGRLSNPREWTADTVSEAEAETGTATTRRAWTAQRVWQAINSWWNDVSIAISKVTGLQTALNSKANLEGGNIFSGNQVINEVLRIAQSGSAGIQDTKMFFQSNDWSGVNAMAGYVNYTFFCKAENGNYVYTHSSLRATRIRYAAGLVQFYTSPPSTGVGNVVDSWTKVFEVGHGKNISDVDLEVNGDIKFGSGTDLQTALDGKADKPIQGAWTPKYEADSGEADMLSSLGTYIELEEFVYCTFMCQGLRDTLSGDIKITGLPFVSDVTDSAYTGRLRNFNTDFPVKIILVNNELWLYKNKINEDFQRVIETDLRTAGSTANRIQGSFVIIKV